MPSMFYVQVQVPVMAEALPQQIRFGLHQLGLFSDFGTLFACHKGAIVYMKIQAKTAVNPE